MRTSRSSVVFTAVLTGLTGTSLWVFTSVWPLGTDVLPTPHRVETAASREAPVRARDTRPAHAPPGRFVLEGRVTAAATGMPVGGAEVTVTRDKGDLHWLTATDQHGVWRVSGLPEGEFGVSIRKAEFRTAYEWSPPLILSEERSSRLLESRLFRGGAFSGRVFDASRQPLSGATVMALQVISGPRGRTVQFRGDRAETDDRGRFRLTGLGDGDYILAARRMYHVPGDGAADLTTYLPDSVSAADARQFTVADGVEHGGLTLVLQSAQTRRVSGYVVTASGDRVQADVSWQPLDDDPVGSGVAAIWPRPVDGSFEFSLLPGRYMLRAKVVLADGQWQTGEMNIALTDGDLTNIVLRTQSPARIRGRVIARHSGVRPGTSLRFGVLPADLGREGMPLLEDPPHLGADGVFEVRAATAPGRVTLFQPSDGWEIGEVRRAGRPLADGVLFFRPGETIADLEVVLRRRASVIAGTLARPVSTGCVVVLHRDDKGRTRCVASMNVRDGEFRSRPLFSGSYRVAATCAAREPPETLEQLWTRATPIDLADDEVKTVRLEDTDSAHAPANW